MSDPVYRRAIVKLSGEALSATSGFGIDQATVERLATDLAAAAKLGVELGVVVGGGNIFRGVEVSERGVPRPVGDTMGMLATVINALALQDVLERLSVPTRVMTAIAIQQVAEPYIRRRAVRHLERGHCVIFAAGTGVLVLARLLRHGDGGCATGCQPLPSSMALTRRGTTRWPPLATLVIMIAIDIGVTANWPWPMATEIVSPGYHRSLYFFCFHSVEGTMLSCSFGRSIPLLSASPSFSDHAYILSTPSMLPTV